MSSVRQIEDLLLLEVSCKDEMSADLSFLTRAFIGAPNCFVLPGREGEKRTELFIKKEHLRGFLAKIKRLHENRKEKIEVKISGKTLLLLSDFPGEAQKHMLDVNSTAARVLFSLPGVCAVCCDPWESGQILAQTQMP